MNYCPRCGQPLTLALAAGRERPVCQVCGQVIFRNPAPVAVVVATLADKILLVQRANQPLGGYWAPPAGYIEIDETVEAGAAREVREETSYEVAIERLVGLHSRANTGIIFAVYQGHIIGGHAQCDEVETLDLGLFTRDELPRQSPPLEGSELDRWFFEIVSELLAKFQHQEG